MDEEEGEEEGVTAVVTPVWRAMHNSMLKANKTSSHEFYGSMKHTEMEVCSSKTLLSSPGL